LCARLLPEIRLLQVKIEASTLAVQVMTEDLQGETSKTETEKKKTEAARKSLMASQKTQKDLTGMAGWSWFIHFGK